MRALILAAAFLFLNLNVTDLNVKPADLLQYYVILNEATCSSVLWENRILTAAHCIRTKDNTGYHYIQNGRRVIKLRVVKQNNARDLALLEPEAPVARGAELGDTPEIGDKVYLVGNPAGYPGLVIPGFIIAIRTMRFYDGCEPNQVYGTTVQEILHHTATSYAGMSGGALFNERGQIVGIHVRAYVVGEGDCQSFRPVEYLWGFAVSVRAIKEFLQE